jgi:26S proteasome non-ATPase regulatory subunit 10
LFISAFIVTAQNGYGRDVDHALHLAHETWDEEQLFDAVKDLPHGALRQMDVVVYPRFCSEEERKTVVDPYGKKRTRLMCAAQAGDVPRLRWLLARGARLELKDWEGHNALWWACYAGRKETIRELLLRGAPLNPADGAPLHGASAGGQVEVVRELLSRGAQLELKDEKGRSALWRACDAGRVETVALLVAAGADCTAVTKRGKTPIYGAVEKGHADVVEWMLHRYTANQLRANTTYGTNVIHAAQKAGNSRIREMLNVRCRPHARRANPSAHPRTHTH